MGPVSVIQTTLKVNKSIGQFVLAGLAVLAGAALMLSWGSHKSDLAAAGIYILAFALASTILVFITKNDKMRLVLSWTLVATFTCFVGGLVESVLQFTGRVPRTACYLRLPIELPETCMRRLTVETTIIGGPSANAAPSAIQLPDTGIARIWLAQVVIDEAHAPIKASGPIFLQFGRNVERGDVIQLSNDLAASGWAIEGGEKGGELLKAVPDQNEIRFFHPEDRESAIALAKRLYELNPSSPVHVRDFSRLGSYTAKGQLEIWLNQIQN